MLALMPQQPPSLHLHVPPSRGANAMSLTLLPSTPVSYNPQLLTPSPSPSKRPKLSLNTTNISPVFGKGSTSLRLETLSATSPTARNTFRNGHDEDQSQTQAPATRPQKPTLTPLATNVETSAETPTPSRIELPDSADTEDYTSASAISATSSASTIDSLPSEVPYKLPFNLPSILTNGPIPRTRHRRLSFTQSKPMFPAPKKVMFRAPLTEDIKTSKYVLRHSDIESLTPSPSDSEGQQDDSHVKKEAGGASVEPLVIPSSPCGTKRGSPVEEDDNDKCPATPVAGRNKKQRQWVWTLGPIEAVSQEARPQEAGIGEEKMEGT